MQLVLSNNRIIAHGENFLAMGGVVINTETGAKYENSTIAECEGCPSDIDSVGYEYHAGVFVPCAPFGKGNNNGYFMEVCTDCATPRNSGIPIKGGIKYEHLNIADIIAGGLGKTDINLLWSNADIYASFAAQTITLASGDYEFLIIHGIGQHFSYSSPKGSNICSIVHKDGGYLGGTYGIVCDTGYTQIPTPTNRAWRQITPNGASVTFGSGYGGDSDDFYIQNDGYCKPLKIYGVKI